MQLESRNEAVAPRHDLQWHHRECQVTRQLRPSRSAHCSCHQVSDTRSLFRGQPDSDQVDNLAVDHFRIMEERGRTPSLCGKLRSQFQCLLELGLCLSGLPRWCALIAPVSAILTDQSGATFMASGKFLVPLCDGERPTFQKRQALLAGSFRMPNSAHGDRLLDRASRDRRIVQSKARRKPVATHLAACRGFDLDVPICDHRMAAWHRLNRVSWRDRHKL